MYCSRPPTQTGVPSFSHSNPLRHLPFTCRPARQRILSPNSPTQPHWHLAISHSFENNIYRSVPQSRHISAPSDATVRLYATDGPSNKLPSLAIEPTRPLTSIQWSRSLSFTPNITVPDLFFIAVLSRKYSLQFNHAISFDASCTLSPPTFSSAHTQLRVHKTSTLAWSLDHFGDSQTLHGCPTRRQFTPWNNLRRRKRTSPA